MDAATWGTELEIPQLEIIKAFYDGDILLRAGHDGVGGLIACLLVGAAGIAAAIFLSPRQIPGLDRNDFPFHTVDGTAAPPPPIP